MNGQRGMALITIIVVLMALVIIATPFSISMRNQSEAATDLLFRSRALKECEALRNIAFEQLKETHPVQDASSPHHDARSEWDLDLEDLDLGFSTSDPKGKIWSLHVEDLQGMINVNGASVYLMANLLGERTRLEEDMEAGSTMLPVGSTRRFPEDGFLWIGGEAVYYTAKSATSFDDIERAIDLESMRGLNPDPPPLHLSGTEVLSYRAFLLGTYCYSLGDRVTTFPTVESIRNICIANEVSLPRDDFDRIREHLTVHSGFPGGRRFVNPQPILLFHEEDPRLLVVENGRYMGAGSILRIRCSSGVHYSMVLRSESMGNRSWLIYLQSPMPFQADADTGGTADVLARAPVNVNTASAEVLEALLTGVALTEQGRAWVSSLERRDLGEKEDTGLADQVKEAMNLGGDKGNEALSRGREVKAPDARRIAEAIAARPVASFKELSARLRTLSEAEEFPLTDDQRWAVLLNAFNSNDAFISGGTAPFTFSTEGCFRIDTAVSDNYPASGREMARQFMTDTAWVAPSGSLMAVMATQRDFEAQRRLTREGRNYVTLPVQLDTPEEENLPSSRAHALMYYDVEPSESLDEGGLQLAPVRIEGNRCIHFDDSDGGYVLAERLNLMPPMKEEEGQKPFDWLQEYPLGFRTGENLIYCEPDKPPLALLEEADGRLWPFSVELWYRFDEVGAEHFLFDLGVEGRELNNRVYLYHDGKELVFRVADASVPTSSQNSDDPIEHAEIRYDFSDLAFEKDVFYHIECMAVGTKPSDLTLFVDGVPRGSRSFLTRLTSELDAEAPEDEAVGARKPSYNIRVQDARSFPHRGVLRIGREVIEYHSRTDDEFVVDPSDIDPFGGRGQRRTRGGMHPVTQSVELYGYSSPLKSQLIPQGNFDLGTEIGPFRVATVSGEGGYIDDINISTEGTYDDIVVGRGFFTNSSTTSLVLQSMGSDPLEEHGFSQTGGFAIAVTEFPVNWTKTVTDKQGRTQTISFNVPSTYTDGGRPNSGGFLVNGFTVFRYNNISGSTLGGITWGVDKAGVPNGQPQQFMGEDATNVDLLVFSQQRCFVTEYAKEFPSDDVEEARVFVFPISVSLGAAGGDVYDLYYPEQIDPTRAGLRSQLLQLGMDFEEGGSETEWVRYDSIEGDIFTRDNLKTAEVNQVYSFLSPRDMIDRTRVQDDDNVTDRVNREIHFRAQHGTRNEAHISGSPALPVFQVEFSPEVLPGRNDRITLVNFDPETDERGEPEGAEINFCNCYGGQYGPYQDFDKDGNVALVALKSGVVGEYFATEVETRTLLAQALKSLLKEDDAAKALTEIIGELLHLEMRDFTRIVKFPSGELPAERPDVFVLGGNIYGDPSPMKGCIDEVRFKSLDTPHEKLPRFMRFVLETELEEDEEDEFYLYTDAVRSNFAVIRDKVFEDFEPRLLESLPEDAGVLLVGDELIAYTDVDTEDGIITLAPHGRGLFNTDPGYHQVGEPVLLLNFPELTILKGRLSVNDAVVSLEDDTGFPFEGAVLIDEEVIGYTRKGDGYLTMPEAEIGGGFHSRKGLLRGRYGTTPAKHLIGSVVYRLPIRYRDLYMPLPEGLTAGPEGQVTALADVPEASYFPMSVAAPGGYFSQVSWVEALQGKGAGFDVRARVGGRGSWSDLPLETPDLFSFTLPGGPKQKNSLLRQGDRIDLRVYTYYEPGAFDPLDFSSNAWKYAPVLEALGVEYIQPTRIVRHEEWR